MLEQDNNQENVISNDNSITYFLGTYSGYIFKIILNLSDKTSSSHSFKSSNQPIKSIIKYKQDYILSSGNDEIIRVYNIINNKEIGIIMSYTGTINDLQVYNSFLFAISENNIEIYRLKDFTKIQTLSGHKNGINSIAIHSSGKLCFTGGRDNYLMLWNLNSYKCSFRYKFTSEIVNLAFINKEEYLIVSFNNKVLVIDYKKDSENMNDWIIHDIKIESTFENQSKIICVKTYKDKLILIFKSNYQVEVVRLNEKNYFKKLFLFETNSNVHDFNKRLKLVDINHNELGFFISIVCSDNQIIVYDGKKIIKNMKKKEETEKEVITIKKFKSIDLYVDRFTCIESI